MTSRVRIKRAYDPEEPKDGYRVFVDRLWPRGLSKQTFKFDVWCKDLAPSTELRVWFGHKVERWEEFRKRYQSELDMPDQTERMAGLIAAAGKQPITLVYSAKDTEHNQAVVLADEMSEIIRTGHK